MPVSFTSFTALAGEWKCRGVVVDHNPRAFLLVWPHMPDLRARGVFALRRVTLLLTAHHRRPLLHVLRLPLLTNILLHLGIATTNRCEITRCLRASQCLW